MFDYLVVRCPTCGADVELKSKGGSCELNYYRPNEAPIGVLQGLSGVDTCGKCGTKVKVKSMAEVFVVDVSVAQEGETHEFVGVSMLGGDPSPFKNASDEEK